VAFAQIVLAAESFEHRIGDLRVTGYTFDMWRVFEDFVTTALQEPVKLLLQSMSSLNASLGWRWRNDYGRYRDSLKYR
jgi:hypothetical protein